MGDTATHSLAAAPVAIRVFIQECRGNLRLLSCLPPAAQGSISSAGREQEIDCFYGVDNRTLYRVKALGFIRLDSGKRMAGGRDGL